MRDRRGCRDHRAFRDPRACRDPRGQRGFAIPAEHDELPATGDERVDRALQVLHELQDLPVGDHVGRYESVHAALQDRLGAADAGR